MSKTWQELVAEGETAGEAAAQAEWAKFTPTLKKCGRCGGKGYGYWLGGSSPPGDCFGCGGSGKREVHVKAAAEVGRLARLAMLRVQWKAYKAAIAVFQAETPVEGRRWAAKGELRDLQRRLALIEKTGKELAQGGG